MIHCLAALVRTLVLELANGFLAEDKTLAASTSTD
jgi:hypothetical protein